MVGAGADGLDVGGGEQALAAVDGADVVLPGVAVDELAGDAELVGGFGGGVEGWGISGHRV